MFASRPILALALVAALVVFALSQPHATSGSGEEHRYVVRPGDTLWEIAAARYSGDPREAIWHIKQRNGLRSSTLAPGAVLVLPGPP